VQLEYLIHEALESRGNIGQDEWHNHELVVNPNEFIMFFGEHPLLGFEFDDNHRKRSSLESRYPHGVHLMAH
jgi:hypothetical protein